MKNEKQHRRCLLAIACTVVLWAAQPGAGLVVSEVMYHPAEAEETLEFVELYNNRAVFEDLSGYAFTSGIRYVFEPGTIIGAGQYLVVARDPAAVEVAYGIAGVHGPFDGRLDNDGERIELSGSSGNTVISFRYDDESPWPVSPDGAGHSLILSRSGGDPEEALSWSPSTFIGGTPGRADAVQAGPKDPTLVTFVDVGHPGLYFKGTQEPSPGPGGQATTAWTQIAFNDNPTRTAWSEGPSGYGYSNDPSELQFIRTELNDMNGKYMSVYARLRFALTAEQIRSFSQLFAEVHYDDGFVLYLNGTRVAASEQISGNPPAFNQSGGTATDPPMANVDLTARIRLLVPGTNILAIQAHNASLSGSSDCFGCPILRAIIGGPDNGVDADVRVVINELLANSDAAAGADWVELYNSGPAAIDLSNVYLSDDRTELLKYKMPDGLLLRPGEFWVVSQGTLPGDLGFGLDSAGETVYVTAATNGPGPEPVRVLDSVHYGAMPPEVTFGRFPDGSDRIAFLSSASFGGPNAQPLINDIVINEIMYHHGTRDERYEYIELYNQGTETVSLAGWTFTDGIDYTFDAGTEIAPGSYLVVARNPDFLASVYSNLIPGSNNLFGPYSGGLDDHSERIGLSYPLAEINPQTGDIETFMVLADEVTYYDGGRWPSWADGQGASLELRDPRSDNDTPDAWADSDESGKTNWEPFSFTIDSSDFRYTHDQVNVFEVLLLNRGEVLLDDLEMTLVRSNNLSNSGFESGESSWRMLGNHVRSFVTTEDSRFGSRSLHLIATGHGDPGANRVNQSIRSITAGTVTFGGWARWLRGSRYLLLRASRERSPVQPPRPAYAFELTMPLNLGTPGMQNTAFVPNRGPDILDVQHAPVLPASGEPIVVTARIFDNDGVGMVYLNYRSEGSARFTSTAMVDSGWGDDMVAGNGIFTATIPGAPGGTMRAFYIEASDGSEATRFPARLGPTADVPDRTCLVRVGDSRPNTRFATYRIWLSNDVRNTFRSRPNLSNELMDCTFVYNDTEVFYNVGIRYRGSPFIRSGSGRDPLGYYAYRLDFNPDQKFRGREEVNLDNTEGGSRGPLQERASYWFYSQMGLQHSAQEFVRPIINGTNNGIYEDVQKIDGDYIGRWFADDTNGYIHKIDDYFEYSADGTGFANLDEGLKYDSRHPLLKETYRWGFEKRSHRENDTWDHLFDFAVAMNTPSSSSTYEQMIESVVHPEHLARVLAVRHAVGDWDSYGYTRGKNNYFYYALPEGKWYLLPWDIDFTLGSGNSPGTSLFSVNAGQFPEVDQFLKYPKYRRMYLQAFAELVNGPWRTSYGSNNPPTAFDEFLDDAANALIADGLGNGRRDGIKQFVRDRRAYILTQIPSLVFEITTNSGQDFYTSASPATIKGVAPIEVAGIAVSGTPVPAEFSGNSVFEVDVAVEAGPNLLNFQGLNGVGNPVPGATDSITVTRVQPCSITSVTPNPVYSGSTVQLTIRGNGFEPGSAAAVTLTRASDEVGFDALYVKSNQAFDLIDAATLLLDDPTRGVGDEVRTVHEWINLWNNGGHGVFTANEQGFAPPFQRNADNFAVRFTGYIFAASRGRRYFGVNSDDGFSLWIDGQLVGEYANPRSPGTTDAVYGGTAGTMTFDFPAVGSYHMVLDYYENGGGEEIEFFQTDSTGGNQRLINVDSELKVFRDDTTSIMATDVVVVDGSTIICRVDLGSAQPGTWRVIVTPQYGEAAQCSLNDGLQVIGR
ncbi:MAG: lamin tail domain-containing protein [Planctomycetota bacterium]